MSLMKLSFLGEGSYARVSLGVHRFSLYNPINPSPLPVPTFAVKFALRYSHSLRIEATLLRMFRHNPYILHCYGEDYSIENKDEIVYNLLLEYASGGSLKALIDKHGILPEITVKRFSRMILKGLAHVHHLGFVHCDIKPQNILVFPFDNTNLDNPEAGLDGMVKIADFGLAKKANVESSLQVHGLGRSRATPLYASPESIKGINEAPMDIWAFGCTVVEMLTGKPYQNCEACDFMNMSLEANMFLEKCFGEAYCTRWTANQLLTHPFVALKTIDSNREEDTHAARYQYHFSHDNWISTNNLFKD